jgi:prepilin-type N-terminal cleavage/methylation domain-containing protein
MISALNNQRNTTSKQGYSLIELSVAITLVGLLLYSSTTLTSFTALFFKRMKIASDYEYQVAPIDLLQRSQVRQCRFSVYADRSTALSNLPSDRTPTGAVLRCDRYDGNGWFLLVWEDASKTLWLEPGSNSSLSTTNGSYPFATLHSMIFDVSQGVLQTHLQIITAMDYTMKSSNPSFPMAIDYVLITQNYF